VPDVIVSPTVSLTWPTGDSIELRPETKPASGSKPAQTSYVVAATGTNQVWADGIVENTTQWLKRKQTTIFRLYYFALLGLLRATYVVHALEDGVDFKEITAARGKVDGIWLRDLVSLTQPVSKLDAGGQRRTADVALSALLHPKVLQSSLRHFEDGDYREAVLNAMLTLTETIREKSGLDGDGVALVSKVFKPEDPVLAFTKRETTSERDEHAGFHKLMLGAFEGVRNPQSHSFINDLTSDSAAQYLAFISLLVRRVEDATKL
jgi:uncharacterized protein (TIGR02391 family)